MGRRREYRVRIRYEQDRDIKVWAEDEQAAEEKAVEIVEGWDGVLTAEATEVHEE